MQKAVRRAAVLGTALVTSGFGLSVAITPVSATTAGSTEVLSGISCVKKVCIVVGSTSNSGGTAIVARSSNDGATWVTQKAPSGASASALLGVSCVTGTDCVAVGQTSSSTPVILGYPSSGSTWTEETPPAADGSLTSVSCATASDCWAGGYSSGYASGAIAETTDGGTTWNPESVPSGSTGVAGVNGVACKGSTTVHCYATGFWVHYFQFPYLMTSTSKRTSWSDIPVETSNGGSLNSVSCSKTTACVAVGQVSSAGYILQSSNGTSWTPETVPSGFTSLNGVSCPTTTNCFAVGSLSGGTAGIATSSNGGVSWTAQTAPSGVGPLESVSCVSGTTCAAVGSLSAGGGAVVVTTNGGTSWTSVSAPA